MYKNEQFILSLLVRCGQIRTKDLSIFINSIYENRRSASREIMKLIDKGFIETKEYIVKKTKTHRSNKDRVYFLTEKGKSFILNLEKSKYLFSNEEKIERRFKTRRKDNILNETENINKLLTDNGILSHFNALDIPTFIDEKPSLNYLKNILSNSKTKPKKWYLDTINKEACRKLLEDGIFYTSSEVFEFIKENLFYLEDVVYGTRFRGVFISNTTCFIIYSPNVFNNRMIKINIKGENGLLEALKILETFTDIYRPITSLNSYVIDEKGNKRIYSKFYNCPHALVFSNGDMLRKLMLEDEVKENRGKASNSSIFLSTSNGLFEKIYVVPRNQNGIEELHYLLTHPIEDM